MTIGGVYQPLAVWLASVAPDSWSEELSFAEIERILGRTLPTSAREYRAWWANDRSSSHSQAQAWLGEGWRVDSVEFDKERVVFLRTRLKRETEKVSSPRPRAEIRARVRRRTEGADSAPPEADSKARCQEAARVGPGERVRIAPSPKGPTVVLVACASTKLPGATAARDLYASSLFRKSRAYAERVGSRRFVLSAKHGLLAPDDVVEPYGLTLKELPRSTRRAWAVRVFEQLTQQLVPGDRIVFLAGLAYREDLVPLLKQCGYYCQGPLEGLRIGRQLHWLTSAR